MTEEELEDAFTLGRLLWLYTERIGQFVEGRICVLHWPAAPDAFLFEAAKHAERVTNEASFYWAQRSDSSLIVEVA